MSPKVTVLMPVYNAEKYLREAMDSMLRQTFTDFEFLIINDGSTDRSEEIIQSYADTRVRYVKNEQNLKVAATLNKGLELALGQYIVRMDSDDISLPTRLEKQVAFMDANPTIGISGTWAQAFGEATFQIRHNTDPEFLRCWLLFHTVLAHPSVIIRRAILQENDLKYGRSPYEDLDLWQQAADVTKISNIPEILLRYRVTAGSAFHSEGRETSHQRYREIDTNSLQKLGLNPSLAELEIHNRLRSPSGVLSRDAETWLLKIDAANTKQQRFDDKHLREVLRERWCLFCYVTRGWGPQKYLTYLNSPITKNAKPPLMVSVKAFLKFCLWKFFVIIR